MKDAGKARVRATGVLFLQPQVAWGRGTGSAAAALEARLLAPLSGASESAISNDSVAGGSERDAEQQVEVEMVVPNGLIRRNSASEFGRMTGTSKRAGQGKLVLVDKISIFPNPDRARQNT